MMDPEVVRRLRDHVRMIPSPTIGGDISALLADWERRGEALEFYADTRRYQGSNQPFRDGDDKFTPYGSPYLIDAHRDGGKIARAALEGKS